MDSTPPQIHSSTSPRDLDHLYSKIINLYEKYNILSPDKAWVASVRLAKYLGLYRNVFPSESHSALDQFFHAVCNDKSQIHNSLYFLMKCLYGKAKKISLRKKAPKPPKNSTPSWDIMATSILDYITESGHLKGSEDELVYLLTRDYSISSGEAAGVVDHARALARGEQV